MQAAVTKTYISRRMLDRYTEERRLQQEQRASAANSNTNPAPQVPPKSFAEDNATGSSLAPIEEEKKEMEQTLNEGLPLQPQQKVAA